MAGESAPPTVTVVGGFSTALTVISAAAASAYLTHRVLEYGGILPLSWRKALSPYLPCCLHPSELLSFFRRKSAPNLRARPKLTRSSHTYDKGSVLPRMTNPRPLVGIVTQPNASSGNKDDPVDRSIVISSYPKWVEAAGARAVPIFFDSTDEELDYVLSIINGVIFTGGDGEPEPGSPYYDTSRKVFDAAIKAVNSGEWLPIHGTCLGFEFLTTMVNDGKKLMEDFDAYDDPTQLRLHHAAWHSHLLSEVDKSVLCAVEVNPITMENHQYGITSETWRKNEKLSSFFEVLSTSFDRFGKEYVSTIESRKYPITASQWHPEQNLFLWLYEDVPHSEAAVELSQGIANFFVAETRRSLRKPGSMDEENEVVMLRYPLSTSVSKRGLYQYYTFPLRAEREAVRLEKLNGQGVLPVVSAADNGF